MCGIGTLLVGMAAIVILPVQLGYKKKAKKFRHSLKLMLPIYRAYMASEEGIIWGDYPADADQIIKAITRRTGLDANTVKEMLDELKNEGIELNSTVRGIGVKPKCCLLICQQPVRLRKWKRCCRSPKLTPSAWPLSNGRRMQGGRRSSGYVVSVPGASTAGRPRRWTPAQLLPCVQQR